MKIIIVGMGQTGRLLAERVSAEGHEVVVIDSDETAVAAVTAKLNVNGVVGSGASRSILDRAGAESADLLVALTGEDEINILVGIAAKQFGTTKVAVRIRRPEFDEDGAYICRQYGIDYCLNSEKEVANEIIRRIYLPDTLGAGTFFHENAVLLEWDLEENSSLAGKNLQEIRAFFDTDILVTNVLRGKKVFIPRGDFKVLPGDRLGMITAMDKMVTVLGKLGIKSSPVKKIFLVGCRTTGYYLAKAIDYKNYRVKILEKDKEHCIALSQTFPGALVVWGDAVDTEVLLAEGIQKADMCIAMTGDDRVNLAVSLFAKENGARYTVARINEIGYERLLKKSHIDVTVSSGTIMAERVLSIVRNAVSSDRNQIIKLYRMAEGLAEALEFEVTDDCSFQNIPFMDTGFRLKKGFLIAAIIREGQVIIPCGSSRILPGDHVVVIAEEKKAVDSLNRIFE